MVEVRQLKTQSKARAKAIHLHISRVWHSHGSLSMSQGNKVQLLCLPLRGLFSHVLCVTSIHSLLSVIALEACDRCMNKAPGNGLLWCYMSYGPDE